MASSPQVAGTDPEPGRVVPWPSGRKASLASLRPPWAPPEEEAQAGHPLGEPQEIEIDHFAISLDPKLDRAEGWDCPNGVDCVNRAHVGRLHETLEQAQDFVPTHSLEWTAKVLNVRPPELAARGLAAEGPLPHFHIVHAAGTVLGYDYRPGGCQIPNAAEQLWHGQGLGEAWRRVLLHRVRYGAEAATLPGRTSGGFLFAFATGCGNLAMTPVDRVPGRLPGAR
ncbi:MAG TPA: hypothetical protein VHQ43_01895 [Solirubrobacterales bacterium]|jgi:hypothetical protein|nr:hypothetical protein [Solirubrobacterales bacterium]